MTKKSKNTLEKFFGDKDKRSSPDEINWLLSVAQIDTRGLNGEQQVDIFYRKIYEGLKRQKIPRTTPQDVALDFYYELMVNKSITFEKHKPIFSTPEEKKLIEQKVVDFLAGLSDAIHRLKSVLNRKQYEHFVPITEMLGPKTLRFGFRDGVISVTYDWENYQSFGPFLLSGMFCGHSVKSLRFCQSCKKLFFSTHYKKVYCSLDCRKDEQSITSDKDKMLARLKSRRAYLADTGVVENAEIAKRLEAAGFISEMRQNRFSSAEIKRLVPTIGQYRRNKPRKK